MKEKEGTFLLLLLFFVGLVLVTRVDAETTREITVSAAVSLKSAFEGIGRIFEERNPGIRIIFNFGASGDLARQIEAGAPVDLFASAARKDMDDLERKGLIATHSRKDFAGNEIVLAKPAASTIPLRSFEDIQRGEVKKIVIGNPRTVPAGRYGEEVLRHLNLWSLVQGKLIFAEHARQALDYLARNEVDAGIIYSTDAMVRSREVIRVIQASQGSHAPIVYPIAVLRGTKNEKGAVRFGEFIQSAEAQEILRKCGFTPVSR